jgi:hypothetical protein
MGEKIYIAVQPTAKIIKVCNCSIMAVFIVVFVSINSVPLRANIFVLNSVLIYHILLTETHRVDPPTTVV